MKKQFLGMVMVFSAGVLALTACGNTGMSRKGSNQAQSSEEISKGGWTMEIQGGLDEQSREIFDAAFEMQVGVVYTPICLLATQIVAGTNYMFLAQTDAGNLVIIKVNQDLEGTVTAMDFRDVTIEDFMDHPGEDLTELAGGWYAAEETETFTIDSAAGEAMDSAREHFTGSDVEVLAYLGSQIVSGTNYAYICKVTPTSLEPVSQVELVTVYQDLDGNCSFVDFYIINPADYFE